MTNNYDGVFSRKWDDRYLNLAAHIATWSKDPSTQVGAVLVNDAKRVVGVGYNGFPDKVPDKAEWLNDRETKYGLVIHAEVNAILNYEGSVRGLHLFVTHPPCADCAKFVIQAGIASITVWKPTADMLERWADSMTKAELIYRSAGIAFRLVDRPKDGP